MLLLAYRTLKREFSKEYRSHSLQDASVFQLCQWQQTPTRRQWYVAYRWAVSIFLMYGLFHDWVLDDMRVKCKGGPVECRLKWLVYCTNWSYSILVVQSLLATYLATMQPALQGSKMKAIQKIYWIMFNITVGLSLAVSLVYWTMVYTPDRIIDFSNLKGHVMNLVLVVADLAMVSHPVRLLHMYQPMALGAAFFSFSAVYFYAGGTNRQQEEAIYPVFDWKRPLWASFVALVCELGIAIMYTCAWCIFLVRKKVADLVRCQRSSAEPTRNLQLV